MPRYVGREGPLTAGERLGVGELPPIELRTDPFARINLAFANSVRLNPEAALRSILNPNSLPPRERTTLADQWGLGDGFMGVFFRTMTDPFVLIGAALAAKFPIPRADRLFKFSKKMTGLNRNPGWLRTRFTGNIDAIYATLEVEGKEVPEVYKAVLRDMQSYQENFLTKMGLAIERFETRAGQRLTPELEAALSIAVQNPKHTFGARVRSLGPAWDDLVSEVGQHRDEVFRVVFANADRSALLQALQLNKVSKSDFQRMLSRRLSGAATAEEKATVRKVMGSRAALRRSIHEQLETVGVAHADVFNVKFIEGYWPHRLLRTQDPLETQYQQLMSATLAERTAGPTYLAQASRRTTPHALPRHNLMVPDPERLKSISHLLEDPGVIGRIEQAMTKPGSQLKPYSLDFMDVWEDYVRSTGRAWAWTVRGHGRLLTKAAKILEQDARPHNKVRASLLRDTFIPGALGVMTPGQIRAAAHFDAMKIQVADMLTGEGAGGKALRRVLGPDLTNRVVRDLVADRGPYTLRTVQGRVASLFYAGALGGNPVSATWNLFQTLLTTVPTIGPKATGIGLRNTFRKASQYFKTRVRGNVGHEEAIARAFPEFHEAGLTAAPLTLEVGSQLSEAWRRARSGQAPWRRAAEKVNEALMSFFQASESIVRLTAFEGTLAKGISEGLSKEAAIPIARRVTELTQFLSGPAATPVALAKAGPALRQFGSFPWRYADWLIGTSRELGSAGLPGRNLGTLGRALLTSGLAYQATSELGIDISDALIFGALPAGQTPNRPFFPFPFVPPILQLPGAAAMDLFQGEFKSLRSSLPIVIPGGVSLARISTAIPPLARITGRNRVDYSIRTPEGKYAVLSPTGQLVGFQSPAEIYASVMFPFLHRTQAPRAERELIGYFQGQAARISDIRRRFLEALYLENDPSKAQQINEEYRRLYPGIGDIPIRPEHRRAIQRRITQSRLERVFFQLPPEVRPIFGQIMAEIAVKDLQSFIGIDPALYSRPTSPTTLDPHRIIPPQTVEQALFRRAQDQGQLLGFARPGVGAPITRATGGVEFQRGSGAGTGNGAPFTGFGLGSGGF